MIIVTHDERIAAMADRIIQMKDGGLYRMENYDCNQSAERVLMDASRKRIKQKSFTVYRNYNYCRRDF